MPYIDDHTKYEFVKFKDGKEGSWYWEFRNKDGSRDKRVKGNFQQASYTSEFVLRMFCNNTIHTFC